MNNTVDEMSINAADESVRKAKQVSFVFYLIALAGAALFNDFTILFSVAFGGSIALLNLGAVAKFTKTALLPDNLGAAQALMAFSFFGRLIMVTIILYMTAKAGWIHFGALAVGLSVTTAGLFAWYPYYTSVWQKEDNERAY